MTLQPITGVLITITLLLTVATMIMWHTRTSGAWKQHESGKALMGLLAVQSAILTLATATSIFEVWPGRPWMYVTVYLLLIGAMARIAWTIWDAPRKHK